MGTSRARQSLNTNRFLVRCEAGPFSKRSDLRPRRLTERHQNILIAMQLRSTKIHEVVLRYLLTKYMVEIAYPQLDYESNFG